MPIVTSVRADIAQPANAIAWQIDESGDGHSWTPANAGASGAPLRAAFAIRCPSLYRVVWVIDGGSTVTGNPQRIS